MAAKRETAYRITANLSPDEKRTLILLCSVLETKRNERLSTSDIVRLALTELAKANHVAA